MIKSKLLFDQETFKSIIEDGFDDETDCAILDDEMFESIVRDVCSEDDIARSEFGFGPEFDDVVDISIDYSDDIKDADFLDIEADDYIAAERDIAFNPFEDDNIISVKDEGDAIDISDIDEEEEF